MARHYTAENRTVNGIGKLLVRRTPARSRQSLPESFKRTAKWWLRLR